MRAIQEHGLEGVVAKRTDSIYLQGKRSNSWQKLPLKQSGEFIGGYRPLGRNFEVLLVGRFEGRRF
jgi:bifunctional non-homologous end joining protein LigD